MWSSDEGAPYEGKHYRLAETMNHPTAISEPHPPIMIGGMGEQKTLRLVAKYADACNLLTYGGTDMVRHKLNVLKGHCEDVGRDFGEIEKTALGTAQLDSNGGMSADEVISMCREFNDTGIEHLIFNMPNVQDIEPLEKFGREVIPEVAGL